MGAVGQSFTEAQLLAQSCGQPIEIADARTPSKREWAQPDGTVQAEVYLGPEWVEVSDAQWERVDLRLQQLPDGSLAPRVHPYGLVLSGRQTADGDHDLVSATFGDARIVLGWRGVLPEPVVDRTVVTWPGVRPGVDLTVEVTATGYEQSLVVHDRAGLVHARDIVYPWRADGLEVEADGEGGLWLRDDLGEQKVHLPAAWMWDAQVDEASGEHLNHAPAALEVRDNPTSGGRDLAVLPSAAFMADPGLEFPVVIDPSLDLGPSWDAFVQTGYTSDQSGSTELKLGTYDGGSNRARSFMSFHDMSFLHGATVSSATLYLWEYHAWSCRSATWEAWRTSYVNYTARWTNQPTWAERVGTSTQTKGYNSSCDDAWVSIDVTDAFGHITGDSSSGTVNIGLRAQNESDNDGWKRFYSANASAGRPVVYLGYTPNRAPSTPTNVKVSDFCDGSCTSGTVVRKTSVPLQATVSDPDGHDVRAYFEVYEGTTLVYSSSVEVGSGQTATRGPTLSNGKSYRFRVRGQDEWGLYSSWSSYFYFDIDTSGPQVPTSVGLSSGCSTACGSPAVVRDLRPVFKATPQHPFDDRTDLVFQVYDAAKTTLVKSGTVANASEGVPATWQPSSNLPQSVTLHLRVRSTNDDYGRSGSYSSWFTFTVDAQNPAAPSVSSPLYLHKDTGTWNGGAGQTGSFTFGPNGSDDVVEYQWRFNSGSTSQASVSPGASHTVSLVPPGDLEQLLQVRSIDHAGNISTWSDYPFYVRPQPVDAGYWKFDETAGALASNANGEPAFDGTLHGNATWAASGINPADPSASGNAVLLDGGGDYVQMARMLATDHPAGFSVSAWVNPDSLDAYRAVVVQSGENVYAYRLYYKPDWDSWCFTIRPADDTASGVVGVCSALQPQVGVWTHLVGVYDRAEGKLRLYVNGGPQNGQTVPGTADEVDAPPMWAATGSFTVGRTGPSSTEWWNGRIDEVRAYQRVIPEVEARQMFLSCLEATCPPVPEFEAVQLVGSWDFEDAGSIATDDSGFGKDGTLSGSPAPQWTAFGYGGTRGAVFDGSSSWVETPGPLPLTDQSFTVSAWVELDGYTGTEQLVLQTSGTDSSAMKLFYGESIDAWRFAVASHDGVDYTWHFVTASTPVVLGTWTHLAGVYDAAAGELRFYVDGQLQGVDTGVTVRAATTGMHIGGTASWGFVDGTIDAVRVYQGAATGAQIADWYAEQLATPPTPVDPVLAGDWRLDEQAGVFAADYLLGNDGILAGGVTWPDPADLYAGAYGASFDGASGAIETFWQPVQTDESFTVSAWVKLDIADGYRSAVAIDGQNMSPFLLYYATSADAFCFLMWHEDKGGSEFTRSCDAQPPLLGQWTHLVGVFDKSTREVSLYVDGVHVQTRTYGGLDPWAADGPLAIGRAWHTSTAGGTPQNDRWWPGDIALVQVYQGPMDATDVAQLHDTQSNLAP